MRNCVKEAQKLIETQIEKSSGNQTTDKLELSLI